MFVISNRCRLACAMISSPCTALYGVGMGWGAAPPHPPPPSGVLRAPGACGDGGFPHRACVFITKLTPLTTETGGVPGPSTPTSMDLSSFRRKVPHVAGAKETTFYLKVVSFAPATCKDLSVSRRAGASALVALSGSPHIHAFCTVMPLAEVPPCSSAP